MDSTNPFAVKSSQQAKRAPSVVSPAASSSAGDGDDRFSVLVDRFRSEQEKNRGLRAQCDEAARTVEELSAKYKQIAEEAERSRFAHEALLKKCRALQGQLKEEREQHAQASGSWFGGGQAAKDLEKCKEALRAARAELRRKIAENENLVRGEADVKEAHEKAMQVLKDKIHGLGVELRMEEEKQQEREKRWDAAERELRAASDEAEAKRKAELQELGISLEAARGKEREAGLRLERVMREKVGWDDSSNPEWAARNAVASGAEEPWGDAAERARWAEAATAAVRSLQGKARAMEAGWGSYAGGGPEDAAARQALRALLGWAGREREGECESVRRTAGAVKRLALAMVALRVRPTVREAGVEAALQHVSRALLALAGAANWGRGAHVNSGPRLARLAEKRLETLREALKDAREAFASLREKDGSRQPSGSALENAVAAASAALAVVRARRGQLESATAEVRGQAREGPLASAASFAEQREKARQYLRRISDVSAAPGVPYARALELEAESAQWATERAAREAALVAATEAGRKAKEEGETLRRELAVLQDVCRTQRGQLQRLAERAQSAPVVASDQSVDAASPEQQQQQPEQPQQVIPAEGSYAIQVTQLGLREDLTPQWEEAERERVRAQVAKAELAAQHWHSQYLSLAMAAESSSASRAEVGRAKNELEHRLQAFSEEKEALHRGYQEQLLLLNDHVIKQSESIAAKDNELSLLAGMRVKCVVCGNWNTIGWLTAHGNGKVCQHGNHPSGVNYAPAQKK
jgi:hypothetical protein